MLMVVYTFQKKQFKMKRYLYILILVQLSYSTIYSQIIPNQSCATAIPLCKNITEIYDVSDSEEDCNKPLYYYFYSSSVVTDLFSFDPGHSGIFTLYRISTENEFTFDACSQFENGLAVIEHSQSFSSSFNFGVSQSGLYVIRLVFNDCYISPSTGARELNFSFNLINGRTLSCPTETPSFECKDCITSFSPAAGQYMVSAWVKESGATMTTTSYSNASIGVSFSGSASTFSLSPSGRIIDGWQRIEGVVNIPFAATDIHLSFETTSGDAYFDDIRFYPLDGSMISYVYDPINLRLLAQLDERNFATFYEYDEEGKLIRVKKETERGVMTIQENRDNIIKQ